jgi:hypothetical protein
MSGIFFIYLLSQGLILYKKRSLSIFLLVLNLALTLGLLIHHITLKLPIRL